MDKALFIADVHLGRLVRLLRMLGFDTLYKNDYTTAGLTSTALGQNRILLTRSSDFAKTLSFSVFIVKSKNANEQLVEVMQHFQLYNSVQPFTRCIACNGQLHTITKDKVLHRLEANTIAGFTEFWLCDSCGNVYWKGSHYERMLQRINQILPESDNDAGLNTDLLDEAIM